MNIPTPMWGTARGSKNFNHSRGEVRSFLQSCANYWLREYHFDGLAHGCHQQSDLLAGRSGPGA